LGAFKSLGAHNKIFDTEWARSEYEAAGKIANATLQFGDVSAIVLPPPSGWQF